LTDAKLLRAYCASKPGTVEDYPFDAETLVFKVKGKMFALMPAEHDRTEAPRINLKCEPMLAEMLRNIYDAVQPGYHMNKRHWNTVLVDGSIPLDEIYTMIDHSYDLVVRGLTKADREALERETGRPASGKKYS
jgi:predicted DNA-binding protein (MmcQ/YjbR family)